MVCAAGSAPGDLHKLWHARDPAGKGYHVEYGYSCMGYEIPGGMGVKLAAPERQVFVLIGDGSYLMLPGELVTAVAERIPIVIVLVDNHGYASIGALSRSVGSAGFGTHYRFAANGSLPVDDAAGAALAQPPAPTCSPSTSPPTPRAWARGSSGRGRSTTCAPRWRRRRGRPAAVVCIETDRYAGVPSYEGWWDVPVAETSTRRRCAPRERSTSATHRPTTHSWR